MTKYTEMDHKQHKYILQELRRQNFGTVFPAQDDFQWSRVQELLQRETLHGTCKHYVHLLNPLLYFDLKQLYPISITKIQMYITAPVQLGYKVTVILITHKS